MALLNPKLLLALWKISPYKKTIKLFALGSAFVWIAFVGLFYVLTTSAKHKQASEKNNDALEKSATATEQENSPGSTLAEEQSAFATPISSNVNNREDTYAHRDLISEYYKSGRFASALPHLDRISQDFVGDTAFDLQAAEVYSGAGQYDKALTMAREGLKLAPYHNGLQAQEMLSLYRLNRIEEALSKAQAALSENPNSLELLTALGTMKIELNPSDADAAMPLLKALRLNPKWTPARYQLGRKNQMEGNYRDALNQFQKVIEQEPFNGKARGQLGLVYYNLQQDKEAEREYETALTINPGDYNSWYNLGELLLGRSYNSRGDEQLALRHRTLKCFLTALEYNPNHYSAHFRAGVLLNGNGQFKEALRHLQTALDLKPNNVRTLVQIAVSYENLNMMDNARDYLYRAFELDPLNQVVVHKLRYMSQTAAEPGLG